MWLWRWFLSLFGRRHETPPGSHEALRRHHIDQQAAADKAIEHARTQIGQ